MGERFEYRDIRRHRQNTSLAERSMRVFSALRRKAIWILLLMIIAAVSFSWHSVKKSEASATATLMLRYEQAYEGLNPNGTRFNIYELTSDAVLDKALERAGLTGEMSRQDLLDSLEISSSGSQNAKNMYIATEYSIVLRGDRLPRRIRARSMLNLLMQTYKQYFLENYGANDSALEIDWSDVENWEYLEFANIMDVKVNNLITYLNGLRTESGMSQYRISGETFRSLSESISSFRDIYLNKYTSFVTINRLFRHPASYRSKLEYQRFLAEQSMKASKDSFDIHEDALDMYDESMITFVMVPMFDSANGLYMARTSIGMDNLTEGAEHYAEALEVNEKSIKVFDRDIRNTLNASSDAAKHEMAEQMIREIQEHLDSLVSRIRLAKRDYEDYRSKNSIYYVIGNPGLMSGYNVKGAAAAALAVLMLFVVCFVIQTYAKRE